jgi:23S rRNA (adenine2503-C2)-methyltransferase
MERENLLGKTLADLTEELSRLGQPAFRARQLYHQLYRRQCFDLDAMTNLAKPLRQGLTESYTIALPEAAACAEAADGCRKYLFRLADGRPVEAVYIPEPDRTTLCLSTQVGCPMGCGFCATAGMGRHRNLSAGEILGQYFRIAADLGLAGKPANIVFMGMGEPLLNYEAVMDAFRLFIEPSGIALSRRGVTLSTSGLVDGIRRLSGEPVRPKLAVSLNAATDEVRDRLMPVNRLHPLGELLRACREFPLVPGERITFEYILIRGVNDTPADARQLARLLRPVRCKINLIPYNEVPGLPYAPSTDEVVANFRQILVDARYTAITRKSRGREIQAACGQLAAGAAPPGAGDPMSEEGDPAPQFPSGGRHARRG